MFVHFFDKNWTFIYLFIIIFLGTERPVTDDVPVEPVLVETVATDADQNLATKSGKFIGAFCILIVWSQLPIYLPLFSI